jgi:hypothetical protein
MIVENNKSSVETFGDIQENEVSIDPRNLSHIITILSSNLYSNPEESFLRETISNAWDSHMEAHSAEPIILSIIENSLTEKSTIAVRDYGTGISPERFYNIYLNIGSSTKRESNEYVGAFGIGKFASLACSGVATITSYYEGTRYQYIMMKNNDRINIDLVDKSATDEANGVEVRIDNVYADKYLKAINKLYYVPNLYVNYKSTNNSTFNVQEFNDRKIYKHKSFVCGANYDDSYVHIVYGNVVYRLDISKLAYKYQEWRTIFTHIELSFAIGTLDVTPNREALLYSDKTIKALEQKFEESIQELEGIYRVQNTRDFSDFSDFCRELKMFRHTIQIDTLPPIYIPSQSLLWTSPKYTYKGMELSWGSQIVQLAQDIYDDTRNDFCYYFDGKKNVLSTPSTRSSSTNRLRTWIYECYPWRDIWRNMKIFLLPNSNGCKSSYFKQWLKDTYGLQDKYFAVYTLPFDDLRSLKVWAESHHYVIKTKGSIDWKWTLWVFQQIRKSLKKIVRTEDLVQCKDYLTYRKECNDSLKEKRANWAKEVTVLFTSMTGGEFKRNFTSAEEITTYIADNYPKHTIIKCTKDNIKAPLMWDIYRGNEHILVISVSKTNAKYLKSLNYIDIDDFLTEKNKKYAKFISEQYLVHNVPDYYTMLTDKVNQYAKDDLSFLPYVLPNKDAVVIKEYLRISKVYRIHMDEVLASFNPKRIDKTLFDIIPAIERWAKIIHSMSKVKRITGITANTMYAYIGMKNKLFRLNYNMYKTIKQQLKVEVK